MFTKQTTKAMITGLAIIVAGWGGSVQAVTLTWSWKTGDAPYVVPKKGQKAIFDDNDGGVWKFMEAKILTDKTNPDNWVVLSSQPKQYYLNSWSAYSVEKVSGSTNAYSLNAGTVNNYSFVLAFIAPVTGKYSISGAAYMTSAAEGVGTNLEVAKVQYGVYSPLQTLSGKRGSFLAAFETYPSLTNIQLNAGDQIAFLTTTFTGGQVWWLADHDKTAVPSADIENKALTITAVPENSSK